MTSEIYLLPLAASICLLMALIEAWFMTMVRYFKLTSIKALFPGYRDLVRSHVDYLMMTALVFSMYLALVELSIQPPNVILWLVFIGALYNPFGFLLQAVKPELGDADTFLSKVGIAIGFLPLSIGLGWSAVMVIVATLDQL